MIPARPAPRPRIPLAPKWFTDWVEELLRWLDDQRAVPGLGVSIEDAAGGGKVFNSDAIAAAIGAVAATKHSFQGYRSPFTGDGDPPADQARRFRVVQGFVNTKTPGNMYNEFTAPASTKTYVRILANLNEDGYLTDCDFNLIDEMPDDPIGTTDRAPVTSSRAIFSVTTDADGIINFQQFYRSSFDVTPTLVDVQCVAGEIKKVVAIKWGEIVADPFNSYDETVLPSTP